MTFKELGLKEEILKAIDELGYENAMPIQEKSIPFVMNETKDLVALAQTGTGKTAGFGLPILNTIDSEQRKTQALILSPTRELCIQIANDLKSYSKYQRGIKVVPVYGGENIITQLRQLDIPPQIIVATPGRLIDLINRHKVFLENIQFLVLDEADEMLNMGFLDDIQTIIEQLPQERRTMLFSATMPREIENISKKYMREREEIAIGEKNSGTENVDHIYYMVSARDRYNALKRVVDLNPDIYGIVFCRTRQETKDVAEKLMKDGYNADALHGDLSQAQRDSVMQKFRIKNLQLLVATDVAARGLDVHNLTHIINYNLPDDTESYTHRSGRTGRANEKGVSISIIHSREKYRIRQIEKAIGRQFEQKPIPNGLEICKKQLISLINKMENVETNDEQIDPLLPDIFKKLEYLDKEDIIKRFVSLEFNRFLNYYKNAPDLNIPEKGDRGDRRERGERGERGDKSEYSGKKMRMKINLGRPEDMSPKMLLGMINDTVGDKTISVGDIEIAGKITYFDVFADQAERVAQAFNNSGTAEVEIVREVANSDKGGRRGGFRGERRRDRDDNYRGGEGHRDRDKGRGDHHEHRDHDRKSGGYGRGRDHYDRGDRGSRGGRRRD